MCLDCFFLETFDDETIVKLFRQCLPLLKMQMSVINPAFAHLFWCVCVCVGGSGGGLHLALLNPSITQGSRINGMQRKAVSARRHAGRIPAAGARREERGAPKQEQIKVSVTRCECVVTGQFLLDINI